jgi:F0F1-type ATP synthase membrane subunit b/b'
VNDAFYESLAIWSQVFGSIAFIIVLVWLFNRFVTPAVEASQERKNAELSEAERRRDAAREDVTVAQGEREAADATAAGIRERAKRDADREHARIVTEATGEGERVVRNAQGELGRARDAARDLLREEILDKALQIARDAATRVDDATNERLVAGVVAGIERDGGAA